MLLFVSVLESLSRRPCDIESYIYMPLIEELQNIRPEKVCEGTGAPGPCPCIAREYIPQKARILQTIIEKNRVDDAESMWTVSTDRNDNVKARWVVSAPGSATRS